MGRAIPSGSRVLVATSPPPRRGEVWAFVDDDGRLLVHRFRRSREGICWFEGDANPTADPGVHPVRLVGRVKTVDDGHRSWRLGSAARWRSLVLLNARRAARHFRRKVCQFLGSP